MSFATILGLIGQFASGRETREQKDYDQFLAFLSDQNQHELKDLIDRNYSTSTSIKAILNTSHDEIIGRLKELDVALASYSRVISGFSGLAGSFVAQDRLLSDQALDILKQFFESGASSVLEIKAPDGTGLYFLDGNKNNIKFSDSRFLEDDLKLLVELRLLRQEFNRKGESIYVLTRAASSLIESSGQ